jgi:hypothetical protein
MKKIAVFVDSNSAICHFFEAECFLIYEKSASGWAVVKEAPFEKIVPLSPALTRKNTEALLPLLEDCDILAGGGITGIPFTVFDRAGFRIFEIGVANDETLEGVIDLIETSITEQADKEAVIQNAKPTETSTPGIYVLDLIALQSKYPEISSKMAMRDFLEKTPFVELHLSCKHIPPWIEESGKYNIQVQSSQIGQVDVVITKRC